MADLQTRKIRTRTAKPGVYFAPFTNGGGVLMDIVADEYLALDPTGALIWRCIADRQLADDVLKRVAEQFAMPLHTAEREVGGYLAAWDASGLTVEAMASDYEVPQLKTPTPLSRLLTPSLATSRLSVLAIFRLLVARMWVARVWKRGLRFALCELQRRQVQEPRRAVPVGVLERTVKAFRALRLPYRAGSQDCLLRSLQLARALAQVGIKADICFGVRQDPFSAHAWVEAEGQLVSDPENRLGEIVLVARF
jgi:transglutaminase superfamily protein/coenzyme PQQ synthesis protein D (PqqD)